MAPSKKSCSNCANRNSKGQCPTLRNALNIMCPDYPELHRKVVSPPPEGFFCSLFKQKPESAK